MESGKLGIAYKIINDVFCYHKPTGGRFLPSEETHIFANSGKAHSWTEYIRTLYERKNTHFSLL